MKRLIITTFCVLCISSTAFCQEIGGIDLLKNAIKNTEKNSVSIMSFGNGIGRCTGVLIKNDKNGAVILTAKHCVDVYEETYVDGKSVKKIGVSIDDDIAYMVISEPLENKEAVTIAKTPVKKDDTVFIYGYPKGDPFIRLGKVMFSNNDHQLARLEVIPGCSGGGVYNEKGELVGIVWGKLINEKTAFFEPLKDVKRFLIEANLVKSYSILVK